MPQDWVRTPADLEWIEAANRHYLDLFQRGDLSGLEEIERWWTSVEMEVPRPLSTYVNELRDSIARGEDVTASRQLDT